MFKCVSTTSLVVPAISETIATSLFDKLFNRLDLPALVGPTIAILKPSRIISPTFWSFKILLISFKTSEESFFIFPKFSSGRSSSGKSILASINDKVFNNFSLNWLNFSRRFTFHYFYCL